MAVTNTNSLQIANAIATPKILNVPSQDGGASVVSIAQLTVASGDSNNSTYRLFRVRSGAVVRSLKIATTVGTSTASVADIGVYDIEGGALVDTNGNTLFATGVDLHTASVGPWTEQLMKTASVLVPSKAEKRIWELLGLSSDPDKEYDVTITMTTATATAALIIAAKMECIL